MITLYQFEDCPYCKMVREALDESKARYRTVEAARDREDPLRRMLFEKSKVPTVPVAEIDGEFIGGSRAIIERIKLRKS